MGFTKTLMRNKTTKDETNTLNTGYTWGLEKKKKEEIIRK